MRPKVVWSSPGACRPDNLEGISNRTVYLTYGGGLFLALSMASDISYSYLVLINYYLSRSQGVGL